MRSSEARGPLAEADDDPGDEPAPDDAPPPPAGDRGGDELGDLDAVESVEAAASGGVDIVSMRAVVSARVNASVSG
jgi:hypothetical protein